MSKVKSNIAAIILAAGKGKRMQSDLPKVLHLVSGQPLLLKSLKILEKVDLNQKIVVVGHRADLVQKTLKGKNIDFALQSKQLGTADAAKVSLSKLNDQIENVLIINGDDSAFYNPRTIKNLLNRHSANQNIITFLTVKLDNPSGFGRVVKKSGSPIAIVEEKDATVKQKKIKEINCGLYVFSRRWLEANIKKVQKSKVTGEYYLVGLIKVAADEKQKVEAVLLKDKNEWIGVNTKEDLEKANQKAKLIARRIHFMGASGAGESAAASLASISGYDVTACDLNPVSAYTKNSLLKIQKGHSTNHLKGITTLVISPAIPLLNPQNEELLEAKKKKIPTLTWQQFIGTDLQKDKFVIAVSGGYGKSTTTAMISKVLEDASFDPTCIIGAKLLDWGKNFRFGNSKYFVCEADEYNNNFLAYKPDIALILNTAWDHPDFFKTKKDVESSYKKFIANIKPGGTLIISSESNLSSLTGGIRSDIKVVRIKDFGKYNLSIIGKFRKENADAALTVAQAIKIDPALAKKSVEAFKGLGRRLEQKGKIGKSWVYDDYAVQPYTVKSTANALKEKFKSSKLLLVFEPHTFSRINTFFNSFVSSLKEVNVDKICITDVFPARETGDRKSLSKKLAKAIGSKCEYTGSIEDTAKTIKANPKPFDVILTMGAGNAYRIYDLLKKN